ncbi:hypothetical protein L1987_32707 [Smallanthus sonchifolius]|uniref:Uncharacterized protein n=1 Tax=Smallanthus sonchifolius TaxID=185202 RepID=A0ACB9HQQ6_9ASTR|nr:hypothetical protein L1987_32707 [Smallanthus sonchifolius]
MGLMNCGLKKVLTKERKMYQMVDFSIKVTTFSQCIRQFAQIVDGCWVHSTPKERPTTLKECPATMKEHPATMTELLASIEVVLELQMKFYNITESSGIMSKHNSGYKSFPMQRTLALILDKRIGTHTWLHIVN